MSDSFVGSRGFCWSNYGVEEAGVFTIDGADLSLTPDSAFRNGTELIRFDDVIITEPQTENGHAIALALSAACTTPVLLQDDGFGVTEARLAPSVFPDEPQALSEPPWPQRMDPDLDIARSASLGNDYRSLIRKARDAPMPNDPISVVIPVYNRKTMLRRTLACLVHQTYPTDLIEVVIADDGSHDEPETLVSEFRQYFDNVQCVSQADEGFRVARIRNLAIAAATHDRVITLDCDMAPTPRLVELHARHLAAHADAVYVGNRRYVDANDVDPESVLESIESMLGLHDIRPDNSLLTIEGEVGPSVDWRLAIYHETASLRHDRHPFRVVAGGNLGFTKKTFEKAGGFDEEFLAWGGEDLEWGYRAWNTGAHIVPIVDACGLHQEPPGGRNETDREAGQKETHPLLIDRVPARYRKPKSTELHAVPMVSIYIPAYNAESTIVSAVNSALNQTFPDLEVCIVDDGSTDNTASVLEEHFANEPRVRFVSQTNQGIGPASEAAVRMCRAPFIGQLDSDDLLKANAVERLLGVLRSDPRIGVVYSSSELIDENGDSLGDSYEFPYFSRQHLMYGMIVHHFRMFRARDWYRTDGFASDIANAVDFDMFLKLSEVTEIVHIPEQLYEYRRHSTSTSRARHGLQRANHRLVVQRSLARRGLSRTWKMSPDRPTDVRVYEFAPTEPTTFGQKLDMVRLSIDVGWKRDELLPELHELFPGWTFTKKRAAGRPRLVTQELSHARGLSCMEVIAKAIPAATIYVVYA